MEMVYYGIFAVFKPWTSMGMGMSTEIRKMMRLAAANEEEVDAFIEWLKKRDLSSGRLDRKLKRSLNRAMSELDCTRCARCCKEAYVVLQDGDIGRLADRLGMRRSDFRAQYVTRNEDGDVCLNRRPCPFLKKNLCTLYEDRPDCCREYPQSLASESADNLDNLGANYLVCPAVYDALERLRDFI